MELQSLIIQNKNKIIHILVFIVILMIAKNIIINQNKNVKLLTSQIEEQGKKNGMLSDLSQVEKILAMYKNILNKKDMSSVINTISNIAADSKIKIELIRPLPAENSLVYTRYPFSLSFDVSGYHALGKFINKIERHPDVYFVDKISIKPRQQTPEQQSNNLQVDLIISTIIFKDK